MNPDVVLAQLYAMRAQLDAVIFMAEQDRTPAQEPPKDPAACPKCGAPEEKQVESNTLDGRKSIMCVNCRQERAA